MTTIRIATWQPDAMFAAQSISFFSGGGSVAGAWGAQNGQIPAALRSKILDPGAMQVWRHFGKPRSHEYCLG